ncbi:MAG TPA: serine/threonine-protein kinase [Planctomycetota bacterium]
MNQKPGKKAILPLLLAAASPLAGTADAALPAAAPLARVLDEGPVDQALALLGPGPLTVGPYRLLRELGAGGMGRVYLAESTGPVRRRVALKVLREGLFAPEFAARFEEERRALAALEHDHVVRLFDSGQDADGRPWLALEYVEGEPITTFCDRRGLDVEARLRLFVEVCAAVNHMHQRGLLHRDLKPANILVSERDGRFVPKLIDLGLASRTGAGDAEDAVVGTPAYMAPEQLWLGTAELDQRCDLFALGLVLRELLIGARPARAVPLDVLRQATLRERPLPSSELRGLGGEAVEVARQRASKPGRLARRLHGALDRIVQRATAVPRGERQDSVAALASEVERDARRHSAWQRARVVLTVGACAAAGGFVAGVLAGMPG